MLRIDEAVFLPSSDIRLLNPANVIAYLQKQGWAERQRAGRGLAKVFYRADQRIMEVTVPLTTDIDNYDNLLARCIYVIAEYEGKLQDEIYADLLFFGDDVVFLREISTDTENGTVGLDRANDMFSGIRKALLSAAHLELDPKAYYPRQHLVNAERFMERCRFGQTKKGSYVMTVTCPLNAPPFLPKLDPPTLFTPAFTRRVTHRLISSVRSIVVAAKNDQIDAVSRVDDPSSMLSSNLCEAFLELTPQLPGAQLEVGVRWAKKQPLENESEPPTVLSLNSHHIPFIEAVATRLKASVLPDSKQSFSGRIDTLDGRAGASGEMEGPVYSRMMDENGDTRKLRIDLNATDYQLAIDAHKRNQLVIIRGIIRRTGEGSLRLDQYQDFQVVTPHTTSS
jgi:hypothetical protein